jgi:hypothetical protein
MVFFATIQLGQMIASNSAMSGQSSPQFTLEQGLWSLQFAISMQGLKPLFQSFIYTE